MKHSIGMSGFGEIDTLLAKLPPVVERKIVKSGIVAMGRRFVLVMRANAPAKSGGLRKDIKNRSGGQYVQFVKIYAPHWHLIEYGTDHRFTKAGRYTGRVTDKQQFVRPTLYTEQKPALVNFETKVRSEIERRGLALI